MKKPIPLYDFWKDTSTKDNVHQYIIEFLKSEGIRMIFEEGITEAKSIAEAKNMVDKAFENLDTMFQINKPKKNNINEAR